jgi:hypothetical protein
MDTAVRVLPRPKVETDQAASWPGAALCEVVAAAAVLWVLEGVEEDPPPVVVEELEELLELETLPETRGESLESSTKLAVMVAFLQAEGGSMEPETKLAAMHCWC